MTSLLAVILLLPALQYQVHATHVAGATITYDYISPGQYLVKLTLLRDCAGITAPTFIEVCFHSDSCSVSDTMQLVVTGPGIELPPCPYLPPTTTSCNGGPGYGVEKYSYTGILILPFSCNDWMLSYSSPIGSGGLGSWPFPGFIVTTRIDNLNFAVNSSIQFTTDPIMQFCVGQLGYGNAHAVDPDGDSLVYALVPTMADSFFCPPQIVPPAVGSYMFQPTSVTPWYIHPGDGWFNFTPDMILMGYISIQVKEYRNGQQINSTTMTHQVSIVGGCLFTSLDDQDIFEVNLFPNPVRDHLNFSFLRAVAQLKIKITTMNGIEIPIVIQPGNNSDVGYIDISNFQPGMYLVSFSDGNSTVFKKMVKF